MKKSIINFIAVVFMIGSFTLSVSAEEAIPNVSNILLNNTETQVNAYLINDNNYLKLRDVAHMLNGTQKQFEVGYDGNVNMIYLISDSAYTVTGGEMTPNSNQTKSATVTDSKILKDGEQIQLAAYNIDDSNYFKLRDIGEVFDFNIDWDDERKIVVINTDKKYLSSEERVSDMDNTYYKDYKIGDKIEINGIIKEIEEFRGTNKRSKDFIITAHFFDVNDNEWIIPMNLQMYGVGDKADYESYIGKHVMINGTYEGYSQLYEIPCITMYELKDTATTRTEIGIRKAEELTNNGEVISSEESFIDNHYIKSEIQGCLNRIKEDIIEDIFFINPNHE